MKVFKPYGLTRDILTAFLITAVMIFTAHAGGIGKQAPDFSLPTLSGGEAAMGAYRGKVILLNFWASWCAPCKEELPELERIYQGFQERGFEVLGINIDKRRKNASKIASRFGLSFPVLLDPAAKIIEEYPGRAMPVSYLIDTKGVIREIFFGFNKKKLPQMETSIRELLNGSSQ